MHRLQDVVRKCFNGVPVDRTLAWTGAGISVESPTSLPAGDALTVQR
jgi:hypothetical protein